MSIIDQLASALNRRDEIPNQELAKNIAAHQDENAVRELIANLNHQSKAIQNDCIKVLYEIGAINPKLIAAYANDFIELLNHKNNRLQWGAMTALDTITLANPEIIAHSLIQIIAAADKGSVITKDHGVNILINLCSLAPYAQNAFPLLIEQLLSSPTNQLPMYAERAIPIINSQNKAIFIKTLSSRLNEMEKESKRKRIEKVIKKFSNS